jgi:hypothetical protein
MENQNYSHSGYNDPYASLDGGSYKWCLMPLASDEPLYRNKMDVLQKFYTTLLESTLIV